MKGLLQKYITLLIAGLIKAGCATPIPSDPELAIIDISHLPTPDLSLNIPGLRPCTTAPDATIHLNSKEPVNVIVHGCFSSAARYRALAQVFTFHGQQAVCFDYNDRDSLTTSSRQLTDALTILSKKLDSRKITVIGHSQGGLIARKAMAKKHNDSVYADDISLRLVTISAPFSGISAASHCASPIARVVSLGLVVPICKLISGDKWYEITQRSRFIQEPGELLEQVGTHMKIVTNEVGTCRRNDKSGVCIEDDFVFSVDEQYFKNIEASSRVENIEVSAGHVEIVGDYRVPPQKLIKLMQAKGILNVTPQARRNKFSVLLSRLYDD